MLVLLDQYCPIVTWRLSFGCYYFVGHAYSFMVPTILLTAFSIHMNKTQIDNSIMLRSVGDYHYQPRMMINSDKCSMIGRHSLFCTSVARTDEMELE